MTNMNEALTTQAVALSEQYLTFLLDDETYGVDVLQVQEIRAWESTRQILEAPDYIKGVLDLRGEIVPIIDLRERFSLSNIEYTPTTVIIVISAQIDGHPELFGIVVDAVSDVLPVDNHEVRSPPKMGSHINTEFMRGMVSTEEAMVMLLDMNKLFDSETLANIENLQEK